MRSPVAHIILALAYAATPMPSPRDNAIGVVLLAAKLADQNRPEWWRWAVWMAAAITIRRIEAA